jgi:hypothetical protein
LILAIVGLTMIAAPAPAAVSCTSRGTAIGGGGGVMDPGERRRSSDGNYVLKMQDDGDLVLYER